MRFAGFQEADFNQIIEVATDASRRKAELLREFGSALGSIFENSAGNQIPSLILALFHNISVA